MARWLRKLPNALSVSRFGVVVTAPGTILFNQSGHTVASRWLFIVTLALMTTDLLDGKLARKLNTASYQGELLDARADRWCRYTFLMTGAIVAWILQWSILGLVLLARWAITSSRSAVIWRIMKREQHHHANSDQSNARLEMPPELIIKLAMAIDYVAAGLVLTAALWPLTESIAVSSAVLLAFGVSLVQAKLLLEEIQYHIHTIRGA